MNKQAAREEKSNTIHEVIRKVIYGGITIDTAAQFLQYEVNYIYTLMHRFDASNPLCYVSKKVGVSINVKATEEHINFVCDEYRKFCERMSNSPIIVVGRPEEWFQMPTYNLFYDIIKDLIPFKKTRMIEILKENNLYSSRSRNKTIDSKPVSVSEAREKKSGHEIQLDGKVNIQFPGDDFTCVAHLAVDAGSNTILSIVFDVQETNAAYIKLIRNVFTNYGVPNIIVTDCRTSFTTNKIVGDKNVVIARGLENLAQLITSSNAKRKNKVESKNDVFQMRILSMLSVMGITKMSQAQECIHEIIKKVNSDLNNHVTDDNFFTPFPKDIDFDILFAEKVERKAHKYSQVQFENKYLFAINGNEILYLKNKMSIDVLKKPNGDVNIKYKGKLYSTIEATITNKKKYSYKYETKKTKVYKHERLDMWVDDSYYHLVDNLGNVKRIKESDSVTKVFDEHGKLKRFMLNGHPYNHVKGNAPVCPIVKHIEIEYKHHTVKYNSTININCRDYAIICDGKQVVMPTRSKVIVVLSDGLPTHIKHEKKMLSLYDISVIDIPLYLPKSHLSANLLFNDPSTDVIEIN